MLSDKDLLSIPNSGTYRQSNCQLMNKRKDLGDGCNKIRLVESDEVTDRGNKRDPVLKEVESEGEAPG